MLLPIAERLYRLLYHGFLERLPERRAVPLGQALLRLLPVEAVGGAFALDDPRLAVDLGGVRLPTPVILSSMWGSTVISIRTPFPSGKNSTSTLFSYGSTPGRKSISYRTLRRRSGSISTKVPCVSWETPIPDFFMNSICSGSTAIMSYRSSPPTRRSSSWTSIRNPSGPHQDSSPSFVVQRSHRSSTGAS